jgi:hypothetical protein
MVKVMLNQNCVVYGINGKRYWIDGDAIGRNYGERDHIAKAMVDFSLMSGDSLNPAIGASCDWAVELGDVKAICEIDGDVYFVNDTSHGEWAIRSIMLTSQRMWDTVEYDLVDKYGEMRKLIEAGMVDGMNYLGHQFQGSKEVIQYIFTVVNKYDSWKDYDDKGDMLSPYEEAMIEKDKADAERKRKVDWANVMQGKLIKMEDDIQHINNINREGGPGSRKRVEKMLIDLRGFVFESKWSRTINSEIDDLIG